MLELNYIASITNHTAVFGPVAQRLGFGSPGEIDRFIYSVYGKAIRQMRPADRLRGAIFILEAPKSVGTCGDASACGSLLQRIHGSTTETFFSIRADLSENLEMVCTCSPADRRVLVNGAWPPQVAQQLSRKLEKCVIWATGVSAIVFISGDTYLESPDVIEEIPAGPPASFNSLSWDDGSILFDFADADLIERGAGGIWHSANHSLLRPRPELLIRGRLGKFLQYRLAGYAQHYEEAEVEHEGRADISLHLVDDRILIVEIKWIGRSLVANRIGETIDDIAAAITKGKPGWLTRFDDASVAGAVGQLVRYYKTGKYRRGYLALFDCENSNPSKSSQYLSVPTTDLDGHAADNFRILRACVDPRSASKRSK